MRPRPKAGTRWLGLPEPDWTNAPIARDFT